MIDHRIKGKTDSLAGGAKNLSGLVHEGKDISEILGVFSQKERLQACPLRKGRDLSEAPAPRR